MILNGCAHLAHWLNHWWNRCSKHQKTSMPLYNTGCHTMHAVWCICLRLDIASKPVQICTYHSPQLDFLRYSGSVFGLWVCNSAGDFKYLCQPRICKHTFTWCEPTWHQLAGSCTDEEQGHFFFQTTFQKITVLKVYLCSKYPLQMVGHFKK